MQGDQVAECAEVVALQGQRLQVSVFRSVIPAGAPVHDAGIAPDHGIGRIERQRDPDLARCLREVLLQQPFHRIVVVQ